MKRIQEPHELMDERAQAVAYTESDFTIPHTAFVERFGALFPSFRGGDVLDVGVGHADIPIRFTQKYPEAKVVGIDGSEAMLALGRQAVEVAGLSDRITLRHELLQESTFYPGAFDVTMANSLLHHLEDPVGLWKAMNAATKPGGAMYVVDLTRPESAEEARQLVEVHSAGAPELMRRDFYNSLLAAFTPEEVREQLDEVGLKGISVDKVSDRHIVIHGTKEVDPQSKVVVRQIPEDSWNDYEKIRHRMLLTDRSAFPDQAFADLLDSEEKWRERIKTGDVLLAYDEKEPIGMIRATYDGDEAMLRNMYTDTNYRGQGLGKRLMEAVMSSVVIRGSRVVRLEVEDTQIPARTMYKKFGFEEVDAIPNERNGSMILMEKKFS